MLVQIFHSQGNVVLRARSSELLIISLHTTNLKKLTDLKEFGDYFMTKALVNRPARKLFEAWSRKDPTLQQRVFDIIHKEVDLSEGDQSK